MIPKSLPLDTWTELLDQLGSVFPISPASLAVRLEVVPSMASLRRSCSKLAMILRLTARCTRQSDSMWSQASLHTSNQFRRNTSNKCRVFFSWENLPEQVIDSNGGVFMKYSLLFWLASVGKFGWTLNWSGALADGHEVRDC